MRCRCCNRNLNDYESTLKSAETGEYLDICMSCLSDIPEINYTGRVDLSEDELVSDDFDEVSGELDFNPQDSTYNFWEGRE